MLDPGDAQDRSAPAPPPDAAPEPGVPDPAAPIPPDEPSNSSGPPGTPPLTAPTEPPSPPGPPPEPPRTYQLPSARQVVSAGLQLVVAANASIRRASIYIGLLSLAAFGPVVILVLVGLGQLLSDPGTADMLAADPMLFFLGQPDILQPLAYIYALVLIGFVLLGAISIDAQAIAIAILGGVASGRRVRLAEAITRARQTFWRLAGAGFIVGLSSALITYVVTLPLARPFDTNTGAQFIGAIVGTLVVTPWAFAGTSIVLGDVGAIEALRRSTQLFRARPRIAFVVVLFTLVTSAIQTFALGAGLDVAVRVAEFFQIGLDQGPLGIALPGILVLAFVVAFGSLTFTIAAIVAAPQVAGFLGLTFYSGGLDAARAGERTRFAFFHWISAPMSVVVIATLAIAALGLPSITGFQPRPSSPTLAFVGGGAMAHGELLFPFGDLVLVEDASGDHGDAPAALDLLVVDDGFVPDVPDWFLDETFACDAAHVACGTAERPGAFANGGYVFALRTAAEDVANAACACGWAVVVAQSGGRTRAPANSSFPHATDAFVAELADGAPSIRRHRFSGTAFEETETAARAAWVGGTVALFVPIDELRFRVIAWDAQASTDDGQRVIRDQLAGARDRMLPFELPPDLYFEPMT